MTDTTAKEKKQQNDEPTKVSAFLLLEGSMATQLSREGWGLG